MNKQFTILIVDDSKTNRALLKGIFQDTYMVVEACDGLEALHILQHRKDMALILLDINMPGMDGFKLLEAIRTDVAIAKIPVVVNTQYGEEKNELKALRLGAIDFITKPYNQEIVMQRVQNVIASMEYERQQTRQELKDEQIRELRFHLERDQLTGIYTREIFCEKTVLMINDNPDVEYVLLLWDIERFKAINDLFGTDIGDWILKEIAGNLDKSLNGIGTYGRLKADNFVCCFPKKYVNPSKLMERLENSFSALHLNYKISLYMGIYYITNRKVPVDQMCDRANLAINTVKGNSIKNIAIYDDTLRDTMLEEQQMVTQMHQALEEGQFRIYIQPIYNLKTKEPVSAEALVRWKHPTRGMILPGAFIPLLERNGFITKLDAYVWEETCKILHRNKKEGGADIPISVNVSRMNLYDSTLCDKFIELIQKYDLDPSMLKLEITESAYMDNPRQLLEMMKKFQGYGFKILTDDFGSGYSSLNMLKDVPTDILKLDMKFINAIGTSKKAENILIHVIHMAKDLEMTVIAEGVETREQLDFLEKIGCENVQGFYFSKPLPEQEFIKLTHPFHKMDTNHS